MPIAGSASGATSCVLVTKPSIFPWFHCTSLACQLWQGTSSACLVVAR